MNYRHIEQEDLRKTRNVHRGSQISEPLVSPAKKEGFIFRIFSDDSEYFSLFRVGYPETKLDFYPFKSIQFISKFDFFSKSLVI